MKKHIVVMISIISLMLIIFTGCKEQGVGESKTTQKNSEDVSNDVTQKTEGAIPLENFDSSKWVGKYKEHYSFTYGNEKAFTKDYKMNAEHIPYIQLHDDGNYEFNMNLFSEMILVSGEWKIDENNGNIVYLLKPTNVIPGTDVYDMLILERVSESEAVLRGTGTVNVSINKRKSTTTYGAVFIEDNSDHHVHSDVVQYEFYDWPRLYINFLESAKVEKSPYGEYIMLDNEIEGLGGLVLHDIDSDGIPELFVGEGICDFFHIYTVKNNRVIKLGDVYFGKVVTKKDLKTGSEGTFVYSLLEGSMGIFRLVSLEVKEGNINCQVMFTEENDWTIDGQSINTCYIRDKKVTKDTYERELQNFENLHETIKEITLYDVHANNRESLELGIEKMINALDEYILSR